MSIHRRAARRDDNEPGIRSRFRFAGWHTEQLSGAGMPDLLVWGPADGVEQWRERQGPRLVDVKMPGGTVTEPQKKKWGELRDKCIPVYVVRTAEDVDALVRGELAAWEPFACPHGTRCVHGCGKRRAPRKGDAAKARAAGALKVLEEAGYTPPRSKPVDAAEEAEETFAPPRCHAGRDGDCFWRECPQEANNRANYNMKGCPLSTGPREDES